MISVPFIYGSTAVPITNKKDETSHTHKWSVYVRGIEGQKLDWLFKKVVFKIHETFPNPNRSIESEPFQVDESGWGEFQITIKLILLDPQEKPITLHHYLQLYDKQDSNLKTMISENYDEIVFTEPFVIQDYSCTLKQEKEKCNFDLKDEEEEKERLETIYKKLCLEYSLLQKRFLEADDELALKLNQTS
jgi:YEATS domain-containing protein 4